MSADPLQPSEEAAIRHLSLSFRAGIALRKLLDSTLQIHGTHAWKTITAQEKLLEQTVHYVPTQAPKHFTFGKRRIGRFLRLLMHEIDDVGVGEVADGVLEIAGSYCRGGGGGWDGEVEEDVYVVFEMLGGREVVVQVSERFNNIGRRVWEAGMVLCGSLERGRFGRDVCGKTVLEIGAGTGISGRGYIEAGAERVLLTDVNEGVVANMRANVGEGVEYRKLDLMDLPDVGRVVNEFGINIVVGADLSYDPVLVEGLSRMFERVLKGGKVVGWVFVMERSEVSGAVRRGMEERGIAVERIVEGVKKWFKYLIGWDLEAVSILRLTMGK